MKPGYRSKINRIIKENYNEIKNGNYNWKDEEVELFYQLIDYVLDGMKITEDREDIVQDLIGHLFTEGFKNLDLEKAKIPTAYLHFVIKNQCTKNYHFNRMIKRNDENNIHLPINEFDKISSKVASPSRQYEIDKVENALKFYEDLIAKDPLLYEYIILDKKMKELATKYNRGERNLAHEVYIKYFEVKLKCANKGAYDLFEIEDKENKEYYSKIRKSISKKGVLWTNICKKISYVDIAKALDVSDKGVNQYVVKGKKELKQRLDDLGLQVSALGVKFYVYMLAEKTKNISDIDSTLLDSIYEKIEDNNLTLFIKCIESKKFNKQKIIELKNKVKSLKREFDDELKTNKTKKR